MKITSKLSKSVILALAATLALLLGYTNCAKSFMPSNPEPDSNGGQNLLDPVVEPPVLPVGQFKAGDSFDRGLLGTILNPGLKAMLDQYGYETFAFRKAIAVAKNGIGIVSVRETASIAENERSVVQACNIISGTECALIASEGAFKIDGDKIAAQAKMLISNSNEALDPAKVPITTNPAQITTYLNSGSAGYPFKALTISPDGSYYWQYGKSQSEVNRRSLNRCELDATITPCFVYAEGSQKVFDLSKWDRKSTLRLAPALVTQADLPFILDGDRERTNSFFKTIADGYVGVIAIGLSGTYAFQIDTVTEVAREKAMTACKSSDATCFVYSEMKDVVMKWDQLASRDVSREAVCGIPRASCQDHKERGCAAGVRWTLVKGSLARVNCE